MARLSKKMITERRKNLRKHDVVRSTWCTQVIDGETILQIDTYGSKTREQPEQSSQNIQIDKETAEYLIKLFKEKFGL